jgi:hypothetical protein
MIAIDTHVGSCAYVKASAQTPVVTKWLDDLLDRRWRNHRGHIPDPRCVVGGWDGGMWVVLAL